MTLTTHAAVGMLATQWTDSILVGLLFAIASHYVIDAIPHGDEFLYWRYVHNSKDTLALCVAAIDVFLLVLLLMAVVNIPHGYNTLMLTVGAIGGVLPDLLVSFYTKQYGGATPAAAVERIPHGVAERVLAEHFSVHMFFHNTMRIPIHFRIALVYQLAFMVLFVYFFLLGTSTI